MFNLEKNNKNGVFTHTGHACVFVDTYTQTQTHTHTHTQTHKHTHTSVLQKENKQVITES